MSGDPAHQEVLIAALREENAALQEAIEDLPDEIDLYLITHGLHVLGNDVAYDLIHTAADKAAAALPQAPGFAKWAVTAAIDGVIGLVLGALIVPLVKGVQGLRGKPAH